MPMVRLLRHGKAESGFGMPDLHRPLAERGRRDSEAAGRALAEAGEAVAYAVVSPAARAQETWQCFAAGYAAEVPHSTDHRIYDNTVEDLLAVVAETPDDVDTVLLVGHNPSIAGLAESWDDGDNFTAGFATATLATFELAGEWADAAYAHSRLVDLWRPR